MTKQDKIDYLVNELADPNKIDEFRRIITKPIFDNEFINRLYKRVTEYQNENTN